MALDPIRHKAVLSSTSTIVAFLVAEGMTRDAACERVRWAAHVIQHSEQPLPPAPQWLEGEGDTGDARVRVEQVADHRLIRPHHCACGWEGDNYFVHVNDVRERLQQENARVQAELADEDEQYQGGTCIVPSCIRERDHPGLHHSTPASRDAQQFDAFEEEPYGG